MSDCVLPLTGGDPALIVPALVALATGVAVVFGVRRRGVGGGTVVVLAFALGVAGFVVGDARRADAQDCVPSTTVAPTSSTPASATTADDSSTTTTLATTTTTGTTTTTASGGAIPTMPIFPTTTTPTFPTTLPTTTTTVLPTTTTTTVLPTTTTTVLPTTTTTTVLPTTTTTTVLPTTTTTTMPTTTTTVGAPDLIPTILGRSLLPLPFDSRLYRITITNVGDAPTTPGRLSFFVDLPVERGLGFVELVDQLPSVWTAEQVDEGGQLFISSNFPNLVIAPGASSSITIRLDWVSDRSGRFRLDVAIPPGMGGDDNEDNNDASHTVTVLNFGPLFGG